MTHDDYVWIGIRVIGLYFLAQAAIALVNLVASGGALFFLAPAFDAELEGEVAATMKGVLSGYVRGALAALVGVAVFALLGRYLLLDGQRVFNWVKQRRSLLSATDQPAA